MIVVVSNPGKQHTHQLLEGIQRCAEPVFATSYWWQPGKLRYRALRFLPRILRTRILTQLKKRYHEPIRTIAVLEFPGPELKRLLRLIIWGKKRLGGMTFVREREFDYRVAHRLSRLSPHIVVGYEMACLETFKEAKRLGAVTVLDLAQIHYREIDALGKRFPVFGTLFENRKLRETINRVKEKELQLADYVLCLSDFAFDSLRKNGIPEQKIFKLNLGFAPHTFQAKRAYRKEGLFRFVFAGTITRRKGIDLLIRAFQELDLSASELLLIGPLTDAEDMLPKNDQRIHHVDHVPQEQLNGLFNDSDLFVFPSYLDSWGMVVVEAMACGLPVVVSKYTGASDAVSRGGGFIIEPTLKSLKEIMSYLYENREKVEQLGKEARRVAEQYTWSVYHERVEEVFEIIAAEAK